MESLSDKNKVHFVLAHSYFVYFFMFLIGVALDLWLPIKIFDSSVAEQAGAFIIALASILIFWAQTTSRNFNTENLSKESFYRGPYKFTRGPTHLGLFLLILGFGVLTNAFFVVWLTIITFFVTKFTFLKKQEEALEAKYGQHYLEYKKSVKF